MDDLARLCVVTQKAGPLTKTYTTDRLSRVKWAARQQCRHVHLSHPTRMLRSSVVISR